MDASTTRSPKHVRERGRCSAGEALQPTATATTVRVRDGRTVTTDGPFAETKEALGGFYLVEAADLDEAIELRGDDPRARTGSIEVRPIWDSAAPRRAPANRPPRRLTPPPTRPTESDAPTTSSTACSARSRAGRSRRSSACSATSTSPRRPSRTRSSPPSRRGRTRRAGQPGRVDHDHGPQPRHRPAAPAQAADREDRGARARGGDRGRPAAPSTEEPAGGRHAPSPTTGSD